MMEPLPQDLADALHAATSLRFVCSGNMVRSAYAELLTRHLGCSLPIDSVGTTYRNAGLYPDTRSALVGLGVSAQECDAFRPRHLADIDEPRPRVGRVAFGMTSAHLREYRRLCPGEPVFLLRELVGDPQPIGDPVLDPIPFEAAFGVVERCVRVLVSAIGDG